MEISQQGIDDELRAQFADRSKLIVRFYVEAERVPITEKSADPNRPDVVVDHKWVDAEWIEIRAAGNKDEIRQRRVRESDKLTWPAHYEAFTKRKAAPLTGTPLDKLPFLTKAQVLELQSKGITTAENLRDVADVHGNLIMGFSQLKKRAVDFLEAAAGNAPIEKLRTENEAQAAELATLKKMIAQQSDRLAAIEGAKAKAKA